MHLRIILYSVRMKMNDELTFIFVIIFLEINLVMIFITLSHFPFDGRDVIVVLLLNFYARLSIIYH